MPTRSYRVLIEANKLFMPGNDGVKRYLEELLESLLMLEQKKTEQWEIDLYVQGVAPFSLNEMRRELSKLDTIEKSPPFEIRMLQWKEKIRKLLPHRLYRALKATYEALPTRYFLRLFIKLFTKKELKKLEDLFAEYDLIHIPLPQNFHYLQNIQGHFLLTVHDLSHLHFPAFHTIDNIHRAEQGMQLMLEKKAYVLAVSEATKRDVIKAYPSLAEKVEVVYGSYNPAHFWPRRNQDELRAVFKKYELPDCPFFLTLSTLEPRKNLLNTLKAFNAFTAENETENIALFICGKKGWNTNQLFSQELLSGKNIFFPGFIAEEDLPVLYSHALALCYVSFYEGFGLPPLEAMACGTTVIYGDNSSMPEVIGDSGLSANAHDVVAIKEKMELVYWDEKLRMKLEEKAVERALKFSRQSLAVSMLKVYAKGKWCLGSL